MLAAASLAIYVAGWPFRLLLTLIAALMLVEWCDMQRVERLWTWFGTAFLAVLLLVVGQILFPVGSIDALVGVDGEVVAGVARESFTPVWLGFAAAGILAVLLGLFSRRWSAAWGFVYIAVPALSLLVFGWAWYGLVFWAVLVTAATDIFAYFAGRSIGGPRLAPRISPKKTWAGLAGGMAGAGLIGWLAADLFDLGAPFGWAGVPMGLIAQAGDLYESWEKRRAGVKDSGTILPGHGGVLDRLDGLLTVTAAMMLMLLAGLWTA